MIKEFFAKLVANFQPRMNLGEKRFLEDQKAHKEASDYNKTIAMEQERERLREKMKERQVPTEEEITGPSEPPEER